jgi:phospholipid/cholesterol/gamma-HCH transport system substrate-binding protein
MGTRVLRRAAATAAAVLAGSLALSGCQGILDFPLPGGAAQGSNVYRVTVDFRDVLDLVPQSAVKVNDVTVGAVEAITLDGWHARVRLRLLDAVKLPDNAVAQLRQTSLLGEKFVSLSPSADAPPRGRLGDGDTIPLSRSGRNPEVEEVLGALSLVLNGGGVAQLRTINVELTNAMAGRESDIQGAIHQLDTFIGGLDEQKADIVRALDGLDHLSATLAAERKDLATAIDKLGPGLKVLADQRKALTAMLTALSELGKVATRVIRASKADTVANLKALAPTLTKLADAGANLPKALEIALTYPFPAAATGAVHGDYTNLRITADLDLRNIISNLKPSGAPGLPTSLPTLPGLPTVPGLPTGLPTDLPTVSVPTVSVPPVPPVPPVPTISVPGSTGLPTISPPVLPGAAAGRTASFGAPPRGAAYDMNLAALMTGGWA